MALMAIQLHQEAFCRGQSKEMFLQRDLFDRAGLRIGVWRSQVAISLHPSTNGVLYLSHDFKVVCTYQLLARKEGEQGDGRPPKRTLRHGQLSWASQICNSGSNHPPGMLCVLAGNSKDPQAPLRNVSWDSIEVCDHPRDAQ